MEKRKTGVLAVALLFVLTIPALAQEKTEKEEEAAVRNEGGMVSIRIDKLMMLSDFLDVVAKSTGKPVLYDPNNQRIRNVKFGASIALKVPQERLLDKFRALLSYFELTMVPVGPRGYETLLVLDSRSTNNLIKNKAEVVEFDQLEKHADRDGVFISCAIPVRNIENLTTLRTALSTMVSPAGIGRVHEVPGSHSIIVMDFAPTVAAVARLIRRMDVAPKGFEEQLEVIELKYAKAEPLAEALNKLLAVTPPQVVRGQRVYYQRTRINPRLLAWEPRNALIVHAMASDYARIRALVALLDQPTRQWSATGVIRLDRTDAKEAAAVIRATLADEREAAIAVDGATNSLVIASSDATLAQLSLVAALLDQS